MVDLAKDLELEIGRWLPKVKEARKKIKMTTDRDFLVNIEAYIKDAEYFLAKNDLIRSFESLIWAWAWLEIGQEKGILK